MDNGVADIDGSAVFLEGKLDDLDRPVDARAESPRRGEIDGQGRTVVMPPVGVVHAGHRRSRNGSFRAKRRSSRPLWDLSRADSLASIEGPEARGNSSIFRVEPGHIRQGCLACQARTG